jgi:hypothetical protein
MQQRRLRLGDILDDYCPRERRLTNHAVVAMIDDEIRQTRCTTCDAEHEYKQAKVPASRRKKTGEPADLLPVLSSLIADESIDTPEDTARENAALKHTARENGDETGPLFAESTDDASGLTSGPADLELSGIDDAAVEPGEDEGPVHRPLIRATLPRPEGQVPERKAPDFTMRQPGGRFDQQRNNQRNRGRQQARPAGQSFGQSSRGNGPRQGSGRPGGDAQRQRNGNRPGNPAGQRGGGRPVGSERGPRSGGGHGRKRGR